MRCLGVEIQWISGKRNEGADALSRTVFPDPNIKTPQIEEFGEFIDRDNADPIWVWKDGKGGYEELLRKVSIPMRNAMLEDIFLNDSKEESLVIEENKLASNMSEVGENKPQEKYCRSEWYREIVEYLALGTFPRECMTVVQRAALVRKSRYYFISETGDLHYELRGLQKRCVVKEEAAKVLKMAHDQGGHFSQVITLRKLRAVYWPRMAIDKKEYVKG